MYKNTNIMSRYNNWFRVFFDDEFKILHCITLDAAHHAENCELCGEQQPCVVYNTFLLTIHLLTKRLVELSGKELIRVNNWDVLKLCEEKIKKKN